MKMLNAKTAHILDNRQILHPAIAKIPPSMKTPASIPITGLPIDKSEGGVKDKNLPSVF